MRSGEKSEAEIIRSRKAPITIGTRSARDNKALVASVRMSVLSVSPSRKQVGGYPRIIEPAQRRDRRCLNTVRLTGADLKQEQVPDPPGR